MSEADKIFEELGYEKNLHINNKEQVWGEYFISKSQTIKISFDYIDKEFCTSTNTINSEPIYINMQELETINQKCKELGWLDE